MGQIVKVQSGQDNVVLGKILRTALDQFVLSDDDFDKLSDAIFTSVLTDLGPSVLATAPVTLSGITEANDVLATFTPSFDGKIRSVAALVTTAVTTAAKAAQIKVWIDKDTGTSQVNLVTITGSPTGGTFTITVDGQTTGGIAYNAAAATAQTALEALSNVAAGDVTVTGSAGGPYTLTFAGSLAYKSLTVSSSGASLTGGTAPAATTTVVTAGDPSDYAATAVDGAVISLTSANCTPAGAIVPGSNVTDAASGPAVFSAGSKVTVRSGSLPTAFSEGAVCFLLFCDPAPAA